MPYTYKYIYLAPNSKRLFLFFFFQLNDVQNHVDPTQTAFLSTSPTFGSMNAAGNAVAAAAIASVGSANQQHFLLSPGEVIRNSGKFPKPTKIPGKTYCKDEVVIRNADSGKGIYNRGTFKLAATSYISS